MAKKKSYKFRSFPVKGRRVPKEMRDAGIIEIKCETMTGAFICIVDLRKCKRPEYGRPVDGAHVRHLLMEFDEKCARPPVISFRAGDCNIVDGNHTARTLNLKHKPIWDAQVYVGLEYHQEAAMFWSLNQMPKKMSSWVAFAAAIDAGRPEEVALREEIAAYGFTTPLDDAKNFDLGSTKVLKMAYTRKGADLGTLTTFLKVLQGRFCDGRGKNRRLSKFMRESAAQCQLGLVKFILGHPELSARKIVAELKKHTNGDLFALARKVADANPFRRVQRSDSAQWMQAFEIAVTGSVKMSARVKNTGVIKFRPPGTTRSVDVRVRVAA